MSEATGGNARPSAGRGPTQEGVLVRMAIAFTTWSERWFPDAFIFVAIAVVVVSLAALANGVAAHALDYDDMCFVSLAHPSAPLVAAGLAVVGMVAAACGVGYGASSTATPTAAPGCRSTITIRCTSSCGGNVRPRR